jgi:hypothetical protein
MEAEANLSAWRPIVLCALLAVLVFGWIHWRQPTTSGTLNEASAVIEKQPAIFTNRTFDPSAPPDDMPPLAEGEAAECDSNFMSKASVAGRSLQSDDSHAVVTFTRVRVALQLNVIIWVPSDASQRVVEHEQGHRQISEYYYQSADKIAERISLKYVGKQVPISGSDLKSEFDRLLRQAGNEITDEYGRELNVQATQLRYDSITDHSRNDVEAREAVARVLKEVEPVL